MTAETAGIGGIGGIGGIEGIEGTAGITAVALAAAAGLLIADRRGTARDRLANARLSPSRVRAADPRREAANASPRPSRRTAAVLGCLVVLMTFSGHGLLAAVALPWAVLAGRRASVVGRVAAGRSRALRRDLPRAADLVAIGLVAGATTPVALAEAAAAVGGPLGERLQAAATTLTSGLGLTDAPHDSDPVGVLLRLLMRSATSGAAPAEALHQLADDVRARQRWDTLAAAHRAGVQAVGPLAACFLPAFVLLGVVPVVVVVARSLLSGA